MFQEKEIKMRKLVIVAILFGTGVMLSGCDKCGDWFWQSKSEAPLSCKGTGPSGL